MAEARGLIPPEVVGAQREALVRLGLPTEVPDEADADAVLAALGFDKKRAGGTHTFILPILAGLVVHDDVTDPEVRAVL